MPPRSKVSKLPPEVKAWLDKALVEGSFSDYRGLEDQLSALGFPINRSSLCTYGQEFGERLSAIKMATEQARAVVESVPDDEGAVNEALMRLVQEHLFKLLMAEEGNFDLPKIARAVAELGKASVVQKKWQAEVRAKLEDAAQKVEQIAKKGGMSSDVINTIRKEILGVAER
ncbi:MAG: DUF3486 family protein [Aeromonas veronii]